MGNPQIIEKLFLGKTPRQLNEDHGIDFGFYGSKISVNYNQIASKSSDILANECRGLVICNSDGSKLEYDKPILEPVLLARPFARFFNLGDGNAFSQRIENTDLAYVKYDGTCIIVYYDSVVKKEWCVATRSVPEANQRMNSDFFNGSFRDLFEQTLRVKGIPFEELVKRLSVKHTYVFELVSPFNRVVCEYSECNVILLACIETETGNEFTLECIFCPKEIEKAKTIFITDHDKMIEYIESLPATESEGIVLVKRDGSRILGRIKIKSENYKNAHRLKDSLEASKRNIVALVLDEGWDDARSLASKMSLDFGDSLSDIIMNESKKIEETICKAILIGDGDRKKTALAAKEIDTRYISYVMKKFDNKWDGYINYLRSSKGKGLGYPNSILDSIIELTDNTKNHV